MAHLEVLRLYDMVPYVRQVGARPQRPLHDVAQPVAGVER